MQTQCSKWAKDQGTLRGARLLFLVARGHINVLNNRFHLYTVQSLDDIHCVPR